MKYNTKRPDGYRRHPAVRLCRPSGGVGDTSGRSDRIDRSEKRGRNSRRHAPGPIRFGRFPVGVFEPDARWSPRSTGGKTTADIGTGGAKNGPRPARRFGRVCRTGRPGFRFGVVRQHASRSRVLGTIPWRGCLCAIDSSRRRRRVDWTIACFRDDLRADPKETGPEMSIRPPTRANDGSGEGGGVRFGMPEISRHFPDGRHADKNTVLAEKSSQNPVGIVINARTSEPVCEQRWSSH